MYKYLTVIDIDHSTVTLLLQTSHKIMSFKILMNINYNICLKFYNVLTFLQIFMNQKPYSMIDILLFVIPVRPPQ